jgi:hypothetical protein
VNGAVAHHDLAVDEEVIVARAEDGAVDLVAGEAVHRLETVAMAPSVAGGVV